MNAPARHIESSPIRAFAAVVESRDGCILERLDRPRTIVELIEASPINGGRACALGVLDDWEGQMIRTHLARPERRGWVRGDARRRWLGRADGGRAGRLVGATAEADRFDGRSRWSRREEP